MKNYIGRIILLVHDYDEAQQFYEKNFGFEKLFDATTSDGQRFLHIGTKKPEVGIWFLKAETEQQKMQVGNQISGPTMVIYTESLEELYHTLATNKVRIKKRPVVSPDYSFFHCYDLYGNEIVVVELV